MTNRRKKKRIIKKKQTEVNTISKRQRLFEKKTKQKTENKETSGINEPRDLEPQHSARKVKIGD